MSLTFNPSVRAARAASTRARLALESKAFNEFLADALCEGCGLPHAGSDRGFSRSPEGEAWCEWCW